MDRLITIVGGSGFIGRTLTEKLARAGARLRIVARNRGRAMRLKPLADIGLIDFVAADLARPETLVQAVRRADAVVNLVGILAPNGGSSFEGIHAAGAGALAQAAAAEGVRALAHVSAIGADPASPSAYGRSKAHGEALVRAAFPDAAILRPSLVFGEDDGFTNRFAQLIATLPVVPVISPHTRFQPVFVDNVAEAIMATLDRQFAGTGGGLFELGGPDVLTMRAINEWLMRATGHQKPLVDVPPAMARLLAGFGFLPGAPLTRDQLAMLGRDNVADPALPGLEALGIAPVAMAAVAPDWLERYRPGGRFARPRTPDG